MSKNNLPERYFALVTGGSSGIGLAITRALTARGHQVMILGRDVSKLERVEAELKIDSLRCDISDPDDCLRAATEVAKRLPNLNLLVNNAGIGGVLDFIGDSNPVAQAEHEMAVNFFGQMRMTKLLLDQLMKRKRASIVNISSGLAYVPKPEYLSYCATKAALHSYSKSLRAQLEETSIKVYEVLPPAVDTELFQHSDAISPQVVADAMLNALEKDDVEVRVGKVKALWMMSRLLPAVADKIIRKP